METGRSKLTPEHFVPLDVGALESERIVGRPIGFWEDSWNRLKKNRGALISLVLIILLFAMAFMVGPLLSRYSPFAQDLTRSYVGPSSEFWFGRDMWTRVWAGTRVSLYIAPLAALFDLFAGVPFGALSGFLGGMVDGVMQRTIEILNGIPNLVVAILAMVIFEPGIITISTAIGLTGWTFMARIVRGKLLQL
jgi:oligopeptide transport system permease protein